MLEAANNLEFEKAALFRDQLNELKRSSGDQADAPRRPVNYRKGRKRKIGV
jgi:excinuclease UvrABC nuclease subunit